MTNRLVFIVVFITFLFAQEEFLAVNDFEGKGVPAVEASALTDRLRTEIMNLGQVNLVERAKMEEILREQGYQQSGCFSSECLVEVGKMIGAQKIISGSISRVGNTFSVNARIIDVETGEIDNSITYDFSGAIDELLINGMRNVAQLLFKTTQENYIESNTSYQYYSNGQVKSEGQLIGNIKMGRWIFYYNNGRIQKVGGYNNNKKIGKWTYFYSDGIKQKEGSYVNDKKNGKWTYFTSDGDIKIENTYKTGILDGIQKFHAKKDSIIASIFIGDNGIDSWIISENGMQYTVNIDSIIPSQYEYYRLYMSGDNIVLKLGRRDPLLKFLIQKGIFVNFFTNLSGIIYEIYPDGHIMSRVPYLWGKAHGLRRLYSHSGKLIRVEQFIRGEGIYTTMDLKNNYIQGQCKKYDGETMVKTGTWKMYNQKSELVKTIDYGDE